MILLIGLVLLGFIGFGTILALLVAAAKDVPQLGDTHEHKQ